MFRSHQPQMVPSQLDSIIRASPYCLTPAPTQDKTNKQGTEQTICELSTTIKNTKMNTHEAHHLHLHVLNLRRIIVNVQKHNNCIIIPVSQTFRTYSFLC
jgi:hypothetical protein